jgi:hypothetical protein
MADHLLIAPPRCGKILRVGERTNGMLLPGDYPCTLPAGHKPETLHACVAKWGEIQFHETRNR